VKTLMKFIPVICGVLFLSSAVAADKVVVIPLNSKGNKPEPEVPVVISATGQVWMALNLGASQVAISSDDPAAYGTLYQWGRLGDGHEYRSSAITTTLSSGDVPGHGTIICGRENPASITPVPLVSDYRQQRNGRRKWPHGAIKTQPGPLPRP